MLEKIYREVVVNKDSVVKKDTVYKFMQSKSSNWEKFLLAIAKIIIVHFLKLVNKGRPAVIAGDDSPLKKNSSKKVEYLSKCWDHTENKSYKGFRLLNFVWSDSFSTVPLGFCLLASQDPEKRYF